MSHFKFEGGHRLLDDVGWHILRILQDDARISFAALGRQVGLSSPAVAERVRKLEEAGIITGYHAAVHAEKIGLPITALIRLSNPDDRDDQVSRLAQAIPEVLECHRITGGESYLFKVVASSVAHLERLIMRFEPYGQTDTSLVLSSPVERRPIDRPEEDEAQ